jgi:hypothetical protein
MGSRKHTRLTTGEGFSSCIEVYICFCAPPSCPGHGQPIQIVAEFPSIFEHALAVAVPVQ